MRYEIRNTKYEIRTLKGFTLIELLIVIAIIGILSGVVLVNTRSGVDKAKRASALTTVSSVLTELAICADDGGFVKSGNIVPGDGVCCTAAGNASCAPGSGNIVGGHTVTWPDISTSTGWNYGTGADAPSGNLDTSPAFTFKITKASETAITCSFSTGNCQ